MTCSSISRKWGRIPMEQLHIHRTSIYSIRGNQLIFCQVTRNRPKNVQQQHQAFFSEDRQQMHRIQGRSCCAASVFLPFYLTSQSSRLGLTNLCSLCLQLSSRTDLHVSGFSPDFFSPITHSLSVLPLKLGVWPLGVGVLLRSPRTSFTYACQCCCLTQRAAFCPVRL